jgi:hypothetical protein
MKKIAQANLDWMQALGVTADPSTVAGVTLRLRGGRLPMVTVHQELLPGKPASEVVRRYVLVPEIAPIGSLKPST